LIWITASKKAASAASLPPINHTGIKAQAFAITGYAQSAATVCGALRGDSHHAAAPGFLLSIREWALLQRPVLTPGDTVLAEVTIAYDAIEGYFPSTGTREYDIYGRSVILATRYEGMRRSIFPEGAQNSVVIIQRKVWMSLDTELRARFRSFDLDAAGIQVRDERDVKVLYDLEIPSSPS